MKKNSKQTKNKRQSTQAVIVTGIVFCVLFGFMCTYMVTYANTHKIEMFNNSYNTYQKILSRDVIRGSIYSSDGELLAYSEEVGDETRRVYPFANVFAHSVGYSSHGRMGIESLYNYYMSNSHTVFSDKIDADVNDTKIPGDDVYSTLNAGLQQTAYDALGVYQGAVIVTEVKTGRILAMVSKPDFDPNQIDSLWSSYINDKNNSDLLNRVTQGTYPPGSTFKIVTALEYLRENPDAINTYHFNCTGSFSYDGTTIQCYHGSVHGDVDFELSFAKSCNSSFANIATCLDPSSFKKTLDDLMFNSELPVDFPYTESTTAISPDVDSHNLMQGAIGQGQDSVTPLHLNMITCAIANDGVLMKPHLADSIKTATGNEVKSFENVKVSQLISEEESEKLTSLMTSVVEKGTATKLAGLSYSAAGKTGSAEYGNVKGQSHAWFTGFAPAEDPEIAVTVIIEGAGSGGDYAVPVAKRIMNKYFGQ